MAAPRLLHLRQTKSSRCEHLTRRSNGHPGRRPAPSGGLRCDQHLLRRPSRLWICARLARASSARRGAVLLAGPSPAGPARRKPHARVAPGRCAVRRPATRRNCQADKVFLVVGGHRNVAVQFNGSTVGGARYRALGRAGARRRTRRTRGSTEASVRRCVPWEKRNMPE